MINTVRLRCMIGWLGIALPWIVMIIIGYVPHSISATYYTQAQAVFMIILGAASFLLLSYKGYEAVDDLVNSVAGFFGLCICLFPCAVDDPGTITGTFGLPMDVSNIIHCASAVVFFGSLALNSFFLFTKTNGTVSKKKKKRNIIYKICGIGMIVSFIPILFQRFIKVSYLTWAAESAALLFFGLSYLTKANHYPWLFADENGKQIRG